MTEDGLFELSDEERMLHQMIQEWGTASLRAEAEAWDAAGELPASILSEADELGLNLISLSEEQGGVGLGLRAALRVVELLAGFEPSLALRVALTNGPVARCAPEGLEGGVTWAHGALQVTEGAPMARLRTSLGPRALGGCSSPKVPASTRSTSMAPGSSEPLTQSGWGSAAQSGRTCI